MDVRSTRIHDTGKDSHFDYNGMDDFRRDDHDNSRGVYQRNIRVDHMDIHTGWISIEQDQLGRSFCPCMLLTVRGGLVCDSLAHLELQL